MARSSSLNLAQEIARASRKEQKSLKTAPQVDQPRAQMSQPTCQSTPQHAARRTRPQAVCPCWSLELVTIRAVCSPHAMLKHGNFFFRRAPFFRSLSQAVVPRRACRDCESARTSCSSAAGPPPWHSPCSGSFINDVAKARCAAAERMPLQRCTQAPRAVTRRVAGAAAARARASRRTNCAASRDQRPPTLITG